MITIIFAPPGFGKTCFLTHILNTYAFDYERTKSMQHEIIAKINSGFEHIKTLPTHCCSANYDIVFHKFRYSPRYSRRINPYRLGFANCFVKTHFNLPYEVIGITEAQKYLNSRMSMYFPEWQSRWYEQHRHNNLEIFLDTQRPMLIDVNIRELSQFIEIVKLDVSHDKFGNVKKLTWHIRKIDNSGLFDKYMASGKQDKTCYTEETVVADYNVFDLYESQNCKPKFYDGHFEEDFDYRIGSFAENDINSYIDYLKENDDELPDNFYQRRKSN